MIRRKEKEIQSKDEMIVILEKTQYITVAMCVNHEPYLVTLNYGYDRLRNCIYFHCAKEGKKIDILRKNNHVWGQALLDKGYVQGACDHLYAAVHFSGKVIFIDDFEEKRHALETMIKALEKNPYKVIEKLLNPNSINDVCIGRIDVECISGKKSEKVIITI